MCGLVFGRPSLGFLLSFQRGEAGNRLFTRQSSGCRVRRLGLDLLFAVPADQALGLRGQRLRLLDAVAERGLRLLDPDETLVASLAIGHGPASPRREPLI